MLTFPVLIRVLEGLNQPQNFIHRAPHRQIIDSDLAKDTLAIDDKEAPEDIKVHGEELGVPAARARGGNNTSLPAGHRAGGREDPTQALSPAPEDRGSSRAPTVPVGNAFIFLQHTIIFR